MAADLRPRLRRADRAGRRRGGPAHSRAARRAARAAGTLRSRSGRLPDHAARARAAPGVALRGRARERVRLMTADELRALLEGVDGQARVRVVGSVEIPTA